MDIIYRPITTWPGERTKVRTWSRFKTNWSSTLALLHRELRHLNAKKVVIEVALREQDFKLNGEWRANAKPTDPGIVVSFDSRYGPLRYATDVFLDWQDNVRAIALGLEALRKVDRYGITKRGEQYTGWKALPAGIALGPAPFASREEAMRFILTSAGDEWADPNWLDECLADDHLAKDAYKAAAARLHPDVGGEHEAFVRLQKAWELVSS